MHPDARRWIILGALTMVPILLLVVGGHHGVHAVRSMLVPGAGLIESSPLAALVFLVAAVVATISWLRWGTDWILAVVVVASMAASAWWGSTEHHHHAEEAAPIAFQSHEFPLVMLIIGALGSVRVTLSGLPGFRWIRGRRRAPHVRHGIADLTPVARCRAASFLALADDLSGGDSIAAPDVSRRAARIGAVARLRFGGDPFRVDHAHARTALRLNGGLDDVAFERFAADGRRTEAGVPASEPGFVRLLDGTLAAVALERGGATDCAERFALLLEGAFHPRRGHRPAWWWSPLGVAAGHSSEWEHAAATAVAHWCGWVGDEDWHLLRQRVLGAAARGVSRRDDERLIAAGRIWLAMVDDPEADPIVARPTVQHDGLAVAMDTLARRIRQDRQLHIGETA